jgi:hypothetical protein
MIVVCVACGPTVSVGDDETSGSGTTTTSTETSSTLSNPTSVGVTTEAPESTDTAITDTTADESTSSTTTMSNEDDSETDPFECGCPEDTPIGLEDELPDGETVAELLARFATLDTPLVWIAYDSASTMVHFQVEYRGGAIALGPGGEDGCLFLSSPCNDGVQMEVVVVATTEDGWLSTEFPAELSGYGENARLFSEGVEIGANAGTLAMQPLEIGGEAATVESLRMYMEHTVLSESGLRGEVIGSVSSAQCGGSCNDEALGDF